MIKLFRKIRLKTLSENKFGKYLIYAIGEIILVVIGILIALQINSKKEEINNRITEQSILTNLKEDFNKNQEEIEVLLFANNKYYRNLNRFIEILKTTPKDIKVKIDAHFRPLDQHLSTEQKAIESLEGKYHQIAEVLDAFKKKTVKAKGFSG